jgi:hypothetical protein
MALAILAALASHANAQSTMTNGILDQHAGSQRFFFPPGSVYRCRDACLADSRCKVWHHREPGYSYSWHRTQGVCHLVFYHTTIYARPGMTGLWAGRIVGR